MFNFMDTFQKKPDCGIELPKEYLDYLSQDAPNGTKYIADKNGIVMLTPTGTELFIGGFSFKPTEEQKKDLGYNYSNRDVLDYIYNSQQAIELEPLKPGVIVINNEEVELSKLVFSGTPLLRIERGILRAFPQAFPAPFNLILSSDRASRTVVVSRKPNRSVHDEIYESTDDGPLYVRYRCNPVTNSLTMTINFLYSKAKCVNDVIECVELVNDWRKGKAHINGFPFPYHVEEKTGIEPDEQQLIIWKKMLSIENVLGIRFSLPINEPGIEAILDIETLYQGLINEKPTISRTQIDSFTNEDNGAESFPDTAIPSGKEFVLEMSCAYETYLFEQTISLPAIVMVFNAAIEKVERKGKTRTTFLTDFGNDKKRYTSMMPFKDIESLQKYQQKDRLEIIKEFEHAKRPSDLI